MYVRRALASLVLLTACEPVEQLGPTTLPRPSSPAPPPAPAPAPAPASVAPHPRPCPPVVERPLVPDPGGRPSLHGNGALLVTASDASTGVPLLPSLSLRRGRPDDLQAEVTTVPSEQLWLELPAGGSIEACISSPGYETICREGLGVIAGATLPVHVKLRRNVTVTGRVLSVAAVPIVDASIDVSGSGFDRLPGCWTRTDAGGYFRCATLAEGAYRLVVRAVGVAEQHSVELEARAKNAPIDVRLPLTAGYTLRFQFPPNVPPRTSVTVEAPGLRTEITPEDPTVHSEHFVVPGRPIASGPVKVSVSARLGTVSMKPLRLEPTPGVLLDVVVPLRWTTNPAWRPPRPRGLAKISTWSPIRPRHDPLTGDQREPDLLVRLVDPHGKPIERFQVSRSDLAFAKPGYWEEWGGAGAVWPAAHGRFRLEVRLEDGRMGRGEIELNHETGDQVLTIPLERHAGLRGRLVDAGTGAPIAHRTVTFDGSSINPGYAETDVSGEFLSLPVAVGERRLGLNSRYEPVVVQSCPGVVVELGEVPLRRLPRWPGEQD